MRTFAFRSIISTTKNLNDEENVEQVNGGNVRAYVIKDFLSCRFLLFSFSLSVCVSLLLSHKHTHKRTLWASSIVRPLFIIPHKMNDVYEWNEQTVTAINNIIYLVPIILCISPHIYRYSRLLCQKNTKSIFKVASIKIYKCETISQWWWDTYNAKQNPVIYTNQISHWKLFVRKRPY